MNGIALVRLILFAGLVYTIYRMTGGLTSFLLVLALVLLGAFIACVNFYYRLKDERTLWTQLAWINSNELSLLEGGGNGFPDGSVFLDSENYLDDLDIFGKRSLFHVLNRTTTSHGTAALADLLRSSLLSVDAITQQQQAIRTLAGQSSRRQLLTARGMLAGEKEGNLDNIRSWLEGAPRLYPRKGLRIVIGLLTFYNLGTVYYYLSSNNYTPLLLGALVSWSITGFFTKYISQQHLLIARKQSILDQYAGIIGVFNTVDAAASPLLQLLQSRTDKAFKAIRQLSKLSSFFDQRLNVLVNILFNTFFFYDLRCLIALERWKITNKTLFPGWIDAVGSVECLNSLATFAFNDPDYVYPQPVAGPAAGTPSSGAAAPGLFIESTRLAHPLIPAAQRVANDFTIGLNERLILVTGSNMSGKTTFLRTIGVNLLLAQCGLPVCAATFSFTPMFLLTSLRISDSLQEHTSYFMAELKKLRKIVHRLQTGAPALVLIDEILRGTNSEDKTHGSELFIRKLIQYRCLSLFATHDLSLGQLEQEMPDTIRNYCFESIIEEGELQFDYRLQRGIARNRNASFLMKKMEII
jgi:DNA mismatch repair ATPase MutS